MSRTRTVLVRACLIAIATVVTVAVPSFMPVALLVAIAIAVHDGARTTAPRWLVLWLVLVEAVSGSPFGTLSLPLCIAILALAAAERSLALDTWANRPGWALGDAVRSMALAAVLGLLASGAWFAAAALGTGAAWTERLRGFPAVLPAVLTVSALLVLLVRASTEPLRRAIVFGGP